MAKKKTKNPQKTAKPTRGRPPKTGRSMGVARLPMGLWADLKRLAEGAGVSRNDLIQEILAQWVARRTKANGKASAPSS